MKNKNNNKNKRIAPFSLYFNNTLVSKDLKSVVFKYKDTKVYTYNYLNKKMVVEISDNNENENSLSFISDMRDELSFNEYFNMVLSRKDIINLVDKKISKEHLNIILRESFYIFFLNILCNNKIYKKIDKINIFNYISIIFYCFLYYIIEYGKYSSIQDFIDKKNKFKLLEIDEKEISKVFKVLKRIDIYHYVSYVSDFIISENNEKEIVISADIELFNKANALAEKEKTNLEDIFNKALNSYINEKKENILAEIKKGFNGLTKELNDIKTKLKTLDSKSTEIINKTKKFDLTNEFNEIKNKLKSLDNKSTEILNINKNSKTKSTKAKN